MSNEERAKEILNFLAEFTCRVLSAQDFESPLLQDALDDAVLRRNALDSRAMSVPTYFRLQEETLGSLSCRCLQSTLSKLCSDCAHLVLHDLRTRPEPRDCQHTFQFFAKNLQLPAPKHVSHSATLKSPLRRYACVCVLMLIVQIFLVPRSEQQRLARIRRPAVDPGH